MLATPASVIYYIHHCIELPLANAHSHIEGLGMWNSLDNDIKQCVSLQSFKQATFRASLFIELLFSYIYCL